MIKPFDRNGVLISVSNALRRRQVEIDNRTYRETLEKMVAKRTAELQDSVNKLQKALEWIIENKNKLFDPNRCGLLREGL